MDFMGFLSHFGNVLAGYAIPFLFVLTVIVFVHELGHFLVARWCGIAVQVFSLGFGPELIGRTDRYGTRWRISAIPLGGYVKFLGDESAAGTPDREALQEMSEEDRRRSFAAKGVGQRAAVVAAGPVANFILAILIFAALFTLYGRPVTEPRADTVIAGSAAEAAGIEPGDVILAIDGRTIESFTDLQRIISLSAGDKLEVTLRRDGRVLTVEATPERREVTDRFGNVQHIGQLGISRDLGSGDVSVERFSPPQALWLGVKETWFLVDRTFVFLGRLVMGRESADQLGGPLKIAQVSGQAASLGFVALVNLAAFLSVNIGLINLFPIPLLDGGHLLFFAAEVVRGRPLSDRVQDIGFRIGLTLVILLMIFVSWNDVGSFF